MTAPWLRQQLWRPLVLILEDDVWLEDHYVWCELGGISLNATQTPFCCSGAVFEDDFKLKLRNLLRDEARGLKVSIILHYGTL